MGINKRLLSELGIIQSAVLMGTPGNKKLLADIQVKDDEINQASPNDLIVAVVAETEQSAADALGKLDQYLKSTDSGTRRSSLATLEDGLKEKPNANLAVISVSGEYAAREAEKALDKGLNVFLFSSNVEVLDEIALKKKAKQKGLLLMGPDCGTSIIGGKGIGFANKVRRGKVGVIGPSGTGLQEFTCLIHQMGHGISHAIGTGTRDLKDEIGGLTTLMALDMLEKDNGTSVVAIVSKPAGLKTLDVLMDRIKTCRKPVVACFLGAGQGNRYQIDHLHYADTIDDAAQKAIACIDRDAAMPVASIDDEKIKVTLHAFAPEQKYVRGLFAGGTFCYQSQQIMQQAGIPLFSNEPLGDTDLLPDPEKSRENTLLDMGDEYFTRGKPHPMIDGFMRSLRVRQEGTDHKTAILLLDIILGFNSADDPVGELLDAIIASKQLVENRKGHLCVVASVTGTDEDPQDLDMQVKLLKEAGVHVFHSNASATQFCVALLKAMDGGL